MNKKTEISVLNVLFCFMVIFIHVTSYPLTALSPHSFAVKILYPVQKFCGVAVYGFIFLSGLKLFLNDKKIDLKKYYFSRIKRVYIPYLIFTVVYYLYEAYRGYYVFSVKELFVFFLNGNVECHLYFVVIIMQFYLLLPLWRFLTEKKYVSLIIVISALLNIIFVYKMSFFLEKVGIDNFAYNDRLFTSYLFFWIVGCICGKNYEKFKKILKKNILIYIIMFLIFLFSDTALSYKAFTGQGFYSITELVHQMYCFTAILFLYSAVCRLSEYNIYKNNKLLHSVDAASYEIYLVHILFVHIINDAIVKYLTVGALEAYLIRFIAVYYLSISSCVLYKKLVKKIKY